MADVFRSAEVPHRRPVVLIIRDGWGFSRSPQSMAEAEGNATLLAETPVNDRLLARSPCSLLEPGGEAVGLPAGQMGNSEVGHLNLGAGRIVFQSLSRISRAIDDGSFDELPALKRLVADIRSSGGRLHVMGLCSQGGVHSHTEHLFAVLELARRHGISDVFVHCISDGRDCSPTGGIDDVRQILERASEIGVGTIATIVGRYFAMDRDKRWDRTARAYFALVRGEGTQRDDPVDAMRRWYAQDKTDEFIPPTVIRNAGIEPADQLLKTGDGFLFFNFRADRARQITTALTDETFREFDRGQWPRLNYLCMTKYDETFDLPVVFRPEIMSNILADVLAEHHLRQFRLAETEKYAHVTYFFNGGVEKPVAGEDRCLVPSSKVATYDLKPEMSALEVTDKLLDRLQSRQDDVVIVNYANPDMVGHTGSIPAATKAVETVDRCVGRVLEKLQQLGGVALVTADHGNADRMLDDQGNPFTAHTTNPVYIFYVGADQQQWKLNPGILADVAPTILHLLGIEKPTEMTGNSLLVPK